MSANMVAHETPAGKVAPQGRFVAPSEFEQGKHLYNTGKPIRNCVTDDMAAGWMAAYEQGRKAYWLCMMQEAN